MISKELLSAVLERKIGEIVECGDSSLNIYSIELSFLGQYSIYELAHKVKEWAWYDQSYQISSHFITLELKQGMSAEDLRQQPVCQSCIANINGTLIEYFDADNEPEAIFQAGEWILHTMKEHNL